MKLKTTRWIFWFFRALGGWE